MDRKVYQYVVVRYIENLIREEPVNVGVIVRDKECTEVGIKMLPERAGDAADVINHFRIELVNSIHNNSSFRNLGVVMSPNFFEEAKARLDHTFEFTQVRTTYTTSLDEALEEVFRIFVAQPVKP